MKKIVKNYLISFFKNIIQSWGLILFIVILVTALTATLSGPLQFISQYNSVTSQSKKWEFTLDPKIYYGNFNDEFYESIKRDDFLDKTVSEKKTIVNILQNYYYDQNNNLVTNLAKNKLKKYDNNFMYFLYDSIFNLKDANSSCKLIYEPNAVISGNIKDIATSQQKSQDLLYIQSILEQENNDNDINKVILKGKNSVMPKQTDLNDPSAKVEILISESYAKKRNIKIGDDINFDNLSGIYKVTGYATSLNTFVNLKDWQKEQTENLQVGYGQIYMNKSDVVKIINNSKANQHFIDKTNFYLISVNKNEPINIESMYKQLSVFLRNPRIIVNDFEDSKIATETKQMRLQVILYVSLAVVLFAIGFIFINFVMKKEFNRTRKQIGIFKALGYNAYELSSVFALKVFVVMIISIALGYLVSMPIQINVNKVYIDNVTFSFYPIYAGWECMLIMFLFIPFLFALISFLIFQVYINKTVLQLINTNSATKIKRFKLLIKKLFRRCHFLFRIQLAFTLKSFLKWIVVCGIFAITTTLFLIAFVVKDVFVSSYNNVYATYNKDVDKEFKFSSDYNWSNRRIDEATNQPYLAFLNDYPMTFIANSNDQNQLQIMKDQADKFHENLNKYLVPENNSQEVENNFLNTNFTHQTIYLEDFKNLLQLFEKFLKSKNIDIEQYSFNLDDLKQQFFHLSEINNFPAKTFISFNQYNYNPHKQFPFFSIEIYPQKNKTNKKIDNFNLNAFQKNSNWNEFFTFPSVKSEKISKMFNWTDQSTIPLIISKKASLNLGLNINDDFDFIVDAHNSIEFKGNIIDIVENETFSDSVYTDYDQIIKHFKNWSGSQLKRSIYTRMFWKSSFDEQKEPYQNYAIAILGNEKFNDNSKPFRIGDFINDLSVLNDIKGIDLLNGKKNLVDIKHSIKEFNLKAKKYVNAITVVQILLAALVLIIIVMIINSIIEENSDIILSFKAQGYRNKQVNFIVIGNYIIGFIFAFILGYLLSLAFTKLALYFVSLIMSIYIPMPWDYFAPLITLTTMTAIVFIAWIFSNSLVQKKKAVDVTKQE